MKTYTTPSAAVLESSPISTPSEIYNGADIAAFITAAGAPCQCVQVVDAPQLTTYHINLVDVCDLSKVKKTLAPLAAVLHETITQATSDTAHFALQISKAQPRTIYFRDALLTQTYNQASRTSALLGVDTHNYSLPLDITKAPHILIAGATGSGKSVLLNSMITSLLYKSTPATLQFVMIDPKQVELTQYVGLPHLAQAPVTSPVEAVETLQRVCATMDTRYKQMRSKRVRSVSEWNERFPKKKMPRIVVVIDELADLMLTSKKAVEAHIVRIAQLGRAAGIHLIVATQRPTVNVITGLIKANIPCRIALQTASQRDSINILDHAGAEKLQGRGDALLKLPDQVREIRFQAAYCSESDIANTVEHWRDEAKPRILKALLGRN